MRRSTVRWFVYNGRLKSEKFVMEVYASEIVSPNNKGRPFGRQEDRVKEYV